MNLSNYKIKILEEEANAWVIDKTLGFQIDVHKEKKIEVVEWEKL